MGQQTPYLLSKQRIDSIVESEWHLEHVELSLLALLSHYVQEERKPRIEEILRRAVEMLPCTRVNRRKKDFKSSLGGFVYRGKLLTI